MRSAEIHFINEDPHWAEYAERPEEAEGEQLTIMGLLGWCVIGAGMWVFLAEMVRAVIRWPYWAGILR